MFRKASPSMAMVMVTRGWILTDSKSTAVVDWLITRRSEQGGPSKVGLWSKTWNTGKIVI